MPRLRVHRNTLMNGTITTTTTFTTPSVSISNSTDIRVLFFNGTNKTIKITGQVDTAAVGTFSQMGISSTLALQAGYVVATTTGGGTVNNLATPLKNHGGNLRFTVKATSAPSSTGTFYMELQVTTDG